MRKVAVFLIISLVLFSAQSVQARSACVVLSKRIAPYIQALEGIEATLGDSSMQSFNLNGKRERGSMVVERIKKSGCSVVVPVGTLALEVVRLQIDDRPIVYTMVSSPSSAVLAAKNIAGISIEPPAGELLDMLKRIIPNATKVGIVYNPSHTTSYVTRISSAAKSRGIFLMERRVGNIKETVRAIGEVLPQVDAMLLVPDPTASNRTAFEFMLLEGLRRGIPLVGLSRTHVREGVLFTLMIDYKDTGMKTGYLVKRIWRGESPQSLKGEPPGRTALVVNAKVAHKMGLHIDKKILDKAEEVFR